MANVLCRICEDGQSILPVNSEGLCSLCVKNTYLCTRSGCKNILAKALSPQGPTLCVACRDKSDGACPACGKTMFKDELEFFKLDGERVCTSCWESKFVLLALTLPQEIREKYISAEDILQQ